MDLEKAALTTLTGADAMWLAEVSLSFVPYLCEIIVFIPARLEVLLLHEW